LEEDRKKIKFTPDYEANEPVFWRAFKELANENNKGLVTYYNLQERLISTGKLDAGGSVLMIEHMEKTGKIEKTEGYNIYKIGKSVATKEEEGWDDMR
jgi:hypothetical protein